ncbi:hypothetical protein M514_25786 [Trichuris suis]|uniref:Uncharacterized protein n=1 Tax=Trichuris suis TaxID=68888 RepID=A0A085MXX1_9BILA|nr:hypothetical protein M514_25786 [Trichuris suis]
MPRFTKFQCYEEAEFIPVFALRRICGGVIRCYEEKGKDTITSITSFIKRPIPAEADGQPQPSMSKHVGISYPPVLTTLQRRTNK